MKRVVFAVCFFISMCASAQVHVSPEFPGGMEALHAYIAENLRYPEEAEGAVGKVYVGFDVCVDGVVRNVKVMKSDNPCLNAEAVRVVRSMPKWNPGKKAGEVVTVNYVLPISFKVKSKTSAKVSGNNANGQNCKSVAVGKYPTISSVFSIAEKKYSDGVRTWKMAKPFLDEKNVKRVYLNKYDSDYQYSDGVFCVRNIESGLYGFIDEKGNILKGGFCWSSPSYLKYPKFVSGVTIVKKTERTDNPFSLSSYEESWYILNKQGETIRLDYDISEATDFNKDGIAGILVREDFKFKLRYINSKGELLFRHLPTGNSLRNIGEFNDGLAVYYDDARRKYGYINKKGEVVIPAQFLYADDFSDGLAIVETLVDSAPKYIFIDTQGEQAFKKHFTKRPLAFSKGYAAVKKTNGKWVYMDKAGNICSKEYNNLTRFYPNGLAFAHYEGKVAVLDDKLNEVSVLDREVRYSGPQYFNGVFWDENDTFFDYQGNTMRINKGYNGDMKAVSENGLVHVKFLEGIYDEPLDGFIDCTGRYIFVFEKEEF